MQINGLSEFSQLTKRKIHLCIKNKAQSPETKKNQLKKQNNNKTKTEKQNKTNKI